MNFCFTVLSRFSIFSITLSNTEQYAANSQTFPGPVFHNFLDYRFSNIILNLLHSPSKPVSVLYFLSNCLWDVYRYTLLIPMYIARTVVHSRRFGLKTLPSLLPLDSTHGAFHQNCQFCNVLGINFSRTILVLIIFRHTLGFFRTHVSTI